jgi:uncharacterized metal-binding protein YceD (DUF177 family)
MSELDWTETAAEIPARGLETARTATPAECAAVAGALEMVSCERIEARYRIVARAGGRYVLDGTIEADVTQQCVVSLDPVPSRLSIPLTVEFVPPSDQSDGEDSTALIDPFADVDVEPIDNGRLDVGRIVMEEIASSLDPYPRRPESTFDWSDEKAGEASPFAALAKLKQRPPEE